MYICIDFDGTLVDHCYPGIGEPVPGAIDWLKRLQRYGVKLILFTMRSDRPGEPLLTDAVNFLLGHGIKLYGVNENPDQKSWTDSPKAYGDLYIDDAAFGCPLVHPRGFERPCVNWKKVGPKVEKIVLGR